MSPVDLEALKNAAMTLSESERAKLAKEAAREIEEAADSLFQSLHINPTKRLSLLPLPTTPEDLVTGQSVLAYKGELINNINNLGLNTVV